MILTYSRMKSSIVSALLGESKTETVGLLATDVLKRKHQLTESSTATEKDEPLVRSYVQWLKSGNTISPVGHVTTHETLGPSAYRVIKTMEGVKFVREKPKTDELLRFESSSMHKVLEEIDKFWNRKKEYADLGLMHSRGVLMHGVPGCGKSCALQQVVEMMINRGDIVLFCDDPSSIVEALGALRQVEPERPVVVVFEEADELVRYNERALLQLMDGDNKQNGVLYLSTTNYIDRLPPRMLRPGRFDTKVKIDPPTYEHRQTYLKHKLKNVSEVTDQTIEYMAKETDGMSFGHMRELIASVFALGQDMKETLRRLKTSPISESKKRSVVEAILG